MLGGGTVDIDRRVRTLEELASELRERRPDLSVRLDDTIFNFAVNDELVLHGARDHAVRDGDIVEIVPAISGG
jgi:molybdopterin converting factor small subunit